SAGGVYVSLNSSEGFLLLIDGIIGATGPGAARDAPLPVGIQNSTSPISREKFSSSTLSILAISERISRTRSSFRLTVRTSLRSAMLFTCSWFLRLVPLDD